MNANFYGADVVELRRVAKAFEDAERELDAVTSTVTRGVQSTFWVGPVAVKFRATWEEHRVGIGNARGALTAQAKVLRDNADAQEKTSKDDGKVSTGSSGSGSGKGGSAKDYVSDGWGWAHDPNASERKIKLTQTLQAASLIQDAGGDRDLPATSLYRPISDERLREMGIDPSSLHNRANNFDAGVYIGPDGQIIVAYPGSEADALDDALGIAIVTSQDEQAIALAVRLREANPGTPLMFVGHSHGGRLAALSSLATGAEAITINAEGLSDAAVAKATEAAGIPKSSRDAYCKANESKVSAVVVGGEWLVPGQDITGIHPIYGERVYVPTPPSSSPLIIDDIWNNHNLPAMQAAIGLDLSSS